MEGQDSIFELRVIADLMPPRNLTQNTVSEIVFSETLVRGLEYSAAPLFHAIIQKLFGSRYVDRVSNHDLT